MSECQRVGWIFCELSSLDQQAPPTMMGCLSLTFTSPLNILLSHLYVIVIMSLIYLPLLKLALPMIVVSNFFSQEVHYHSRGLGINPNLYSCGRVCLSLLNTWAGRGNEKWLPNRSTVLQVLVSIQALVLNEKPFFNEPGYDSTYTGSEGARRSKKYNEKIFISSLKTMVYTLRSPPRVCFAISLPVCSAIHDMLLLNSSTNCLLLYM